MVQMLLLILILLLPFPADAAYKIYLKNGSVLSGVSSYEKKNGEVTVYFGGGSIGVPEKDILKIEESGAAERDFRAPEAPAGREQVPPAPPVADTDNRSERKAAVQSQLDAVDEEIRTVEQEEARIVKAINDRKGTRLTYNTLQLRQLESDLAPLRQELSDVQVKKGALLQKKTMLEEDFRSLQ